LLLRDGLCEVCQAVLPKQLREEIATLKEELRAGNHLFAVATDRQRDLEAENAKLKDALQALCDEQNGPPLIRRKDSWQAAMDKARDLLRIIFELDPLGGRLKECRHVSTRVEGKVEAGNPYGRRICNDCGKIGPWQICRYLDEPSALKE